jgi:hypothetical protein
MVVLASALAIQSAAEAGPIKVEIDGVEQSATYNDGDTIVIEIPPFDGVKRIRVYDSTLGPDGVADDAVGSITINGGQPLSTTARMDFWITRNASFPVQFGVTIPPSQIGLAAMGTSSDGITITNPDLRRQTRVAIATVSDIRGDITAGQIFRIQAGIANQFGNPLFSGEVSANITGGWHKLPSRNI